MTNQTKPNYTLPLIIMSALFFLFGFITTMNNSLIKYLGDAFLLDDGIRSLSAESLNALREYILNGVKPAEDSIKSLVQPLIDKWDVKRQYINFAFFGSYIFSIPIGLLLRKIGYKGGLMLGLVIVGIGFVTTALFGTSGFGMFLACMFIVALGVVLLQVAANPYITALGDPATASSRLSLTQALNSLATTAAPLFIVAFIIPSGDPDPKSVSGPFFAIAAFTLVVAVVLNFFKLPAIQDEDKTAEFTGSYKSSAWKYKNLILGTIAIFMYMGVEIGVPSFFSPFIDYIGLNGKVNPTAMLSFYWGGMLIGRFLGTVILNKFKTEIVLAISLATSAILVLAAILIGPSAPNVAMWMFIATGLFHSIMWPAIFSLSIADLGPHSKMGSGIFCTAVIGGAILPLAMGQIQVASGVIFAIATMFVYYLYMTFFALKGAKLR